jgi:hypothetical protein
MSFTGKPARNVVERVREFRATLAEGAVNGDLPGPYYTRPRFPGCINVNWWYNGQQSGMRFEKAGVRISIKSKQKIQKKHFEMFYVV